MQKKSSRTRFVKPTLDTSSRKDRMFTKPYHSESSKRNIAFPGLLKEGSELESKESLNTLICGATVFEAKPLNSTFTWNKFASLDDHKHTHPQAHSSPRPRHTHTHLLHLLHANSLGNEATVTVWGSILIKKTECDQISPWWASVLFLWAVGCKPKCKVCVPFLPSDVHFFTGKLKASSAPCSP